MLKMGIPLFNVATDLPTIIDEERTFLLKCLCRSKKAFFKKPQYLSVQGKANAFKACLPGEMLIIMHLRKMPYLKLTENVLLARSFADL